MKENTHPNYKAIKVTCSCGNSFQTSSTIGKDLNVEICNKCHPFYTGEQRVVDTQGRVDSFATRFGNFGALARKKKEDK